MMVNQQKERESRSGDKVAGRTGGTRGREDAFPRTRSGKLCLEGETQREGGQM